MSNTDITQTASQPDITLVMGKYGAHVPRYMGRRRSIPGDPPRVRMLRESFVPPNDRIAQLVTARDRLRAALAAVEQQLTE